MNTLKIASVLLTAAIMTGCASTSSEPTGSYARQVATAGGLRLEDQKVPKAQYDAALSSVTDAGLNTSVLASSHGFNMNGGAALGVGLAAWLFSPQAPEQKDAVIAFAPMSLGSKDQASDKFAKMVGEAYKKAFEEMNSFDVSDVVKEDSLGSRYKVAGVGPGCTESQTKPNVRCLFGAEVEKPIIRRAPESLLGSNSDVYLFRAQEKVLRDYSRNAEDFNKQTFLRNVSKHLPDWAYVYAAPVRKVSPPMIFHKGEVHYFVVPDA
ncbi:hypothetical protein EAW52_24845 [Pseudomonas sp. LTJR-52]|uniref:hypothetical protein n=1 Tax=Pseudomonas TaxID=286 RepID=UPI000EFA85D6|nr:MULTISPECIES: hypothetical protein [Pseudomonas]AYN96928.1 hypothetical protein EAW52_24845 [Pseudomonas sp. LTJR-52]RRW40576.1 hypothetical protein EGJ50_24260 [Pseudomonas luteola]